MAGNAQIPVMTGGSVNSDLPLTSHHKLTAEIDHHLHQACSGVFTVSPVTLL